MCNLLLHQNFLDLKVLKEPNLTIEDIDYSKTVNYKDIYKITFTLKSESGVNDIIGIRSFSTI